MGERVGKNLEHLVSCRVALSDRQKDIRSGKLGVAIISVDSLELFKRAGRVTRFRVAKVASLGEKVLIRTDVNDTEPADVGEGFVAVSIERIRHPSPDHFIFWRIVGVLQAEEHKKKNLASTENQI